MKQVLNYTAFLSMMIAIVACKHDNIENLLGPDLNKSGLLCVPDDFTYSEPAIINDSSINFLIAKVDYSVELNHEVTWEFGVIGSGGSQYRKTGFGNVMSIFWEGNTSNAIPFENDDTVNIYYLFNCMDTIWASQLTVENGRNYDAVVVDDFDLGGPVSSWANANGQLAELNISASDSGAAQGNNYLRLIGEDLGLGSYLGQAMASPTVIDFGLTTTAEALYLNSIVRATPNTVLEYRIYENDGDWFSYEKTVDWSGWQTVSIRYDEFSPKVSSDGPEPNEIKQVRITLRSLDPEKGNVANIDFITFSQGSPLEL